MLNSQDIKQKARELGFDACGIAPASDLPELGFFREWLDRGYAGEMAHSSDLLTVALMFAACFPPPAW